jgi:GTP-binding protein
VHNIEHDDYVGRLAIGRVHRGFLGPGQTVALLQSDSQQTGRVGPVYVYEGLSRSKADRVAAGEIIAIAGFEDVQIGDTITSPEHRDALPRIVVEEPTIKVRFIVNDSPYAGKVGKWVTSRHLRERLLKESKRNIALLVEETDEADTFVVYGRGELMLAVLAETMRREGYEFAVAMPEVVTREIDGRRCEPFEIVVIDVAEEYVGAVTTSLGERRGQMLKIGAPGSGRCRLEFRVPSRGLMG